MAGKTAGKGRLKLLLVAAVFAAPMLAAYVLYYSGWRPDHVRPYGDLMTPARKIANAELTTLDGAKTTLLSSQPRWSFVYFGPSACDSACERALYAMRQLIAAQGREAYRMRAVMVLTDQRAVDALRPRLKDYPDMTVLSGPAEAVARAARDFDTPAGSALAGQHRIYLVDPLGNLVLSYPQGADLSGISKDLKRLLRYSQIG